MQSPLKQWLIRGAIVLGVLAVLVGVLLLGVWWRYGGGEPFPDRDVGEPMLSADRLEVVAALDVPPGNVAVSPSGRVFFTYHPVAGPDVNVAELTDTGPVPYPNAAFQSPRESDRYFRSPLSVRIDRQGQLWVLDAAHHGWENPRLWAFDLDTGEVVHRHVFGSGVAGLGSHYNDFQVSPDGRWIFIADASVLAQTPALVVYDVREGRARRLLEGHESVAAEPYVPVVQGRRMLLFGLFAVRPGVDSIALSRDGQVLYFAAVTARHMYRVRTEVLTHPGRVPGPLGEWVETHAEKTMSDGITSDSAGNLYLSDLERSAIHRLGPEGDLRTLVRSERLRWPDGFSFGPDGWLYVTASSLHEIMGRGGGAVEQHAPYHIFRVKTDAHAHPGH